MFEEEIRILTETIARRTIGAAQSIALREILASEIPHPIKTFFRADVEALLADELRRERKGTRFFHDHPEVQNLQQQINAILVLHFTFEREGFLQRLDDTVHMMVNYLVRPQWTLAGVLFESDRQISTQALVRLFRYFGPYEYYKDVVSRYVDDKQLTSFSKEEFASLLFKVDSGFIRRKTGDELARVLLPLYDFFDFPFKTGTNALPVRALIKFFEDKGMTQVLLRLEGERAQQTENLSRAALGQILEDVRRTSGAFEAEEPDAAPVAVEAAPEPAAASIDLLGAIGDKDKRRFIIRIFKQDEGAFTEALQSMATLPSWKEASKFIDEIFIRNDIDPYSYDAERFSGILFQQYHRTS